MEQQRYPKRRRGKLSSCIPSSSQSSLLAIDDKISTIPAHILHDIFNFLPTKCVARTSILSKRFNDIWLKYPIMDLNEYDHPNNKLKHKLLHRMCMCCETHDFTFLEKLKIHAREPTNKIFNKYLSLEVDKFISKASGANTLKEIELQFPVSKKKPTIQDLSNLNRFNRRFYLLPQIPLCSFCKSLKFLKLKGCRFEGNHGIVLPSLIELHIKYCSLPDDNFVSRLLDGCPQLEKFSFKFNLPGRKIQFFHSKIKHLVLGCYDSTTIFEIVASNLQTLKFIGTHWKNNDNNGMMRYRPQNHTISAPNLEKLVVKNVFLDDESIKLALSTFKNLKELELYGCVLIDEPIFESVKIEKLSILSCSFGQDQLVICSSRLPQIKHLTIYACNGLKWLTIHRVKDSQRLIYRIQGCPDFRELHQIN